MLKFVKSLLSKLFTVVSFVSIFCFFPSNVLAFTENFTSNPSTNPNWNVNVGGSILYNQPGIVLSSSNSNVYPYLYTSSITDFSTQRYFEIKFRYLNSSPWGVGIVLTDLAPLPNTNMPLISDYVKYAMFYVWGSSLHVVSTICPDNAVLCTASRWVVFPNTTPSSEDFSKITLDNNEHIFSVERYDLPSSLFQYKIYLDSKLLITTEPTNRIIHSAWLGNPNVLNSPQSEWASLKVLSLFTNETITTTSPTFLYFSQKDPAWGSREYDTASKWAGLDKSGIDRWGCALTSVAMILQNYNIQSPSGEVVTPLILNDWLKSQSDGYIGAGLLNWLAVTRYVRSSYLAGHASTKLEYTRSTPPSSPTLPAILGTSGHFVVSHSEDATNWLINDPANKTKTTLPKTTTLSSIGRFVPSLTDLSYMMFGADPALHVSLVDSKGKTVPVSWTQEYLSDDVGGSDSPTIAVAMLPKPQSGKYSLKIDNPSRSTKNSEIYMYDTNGEVYVKKLSVGPDTQIKFELSYNRSSSTKSKLEHEKRYRMEWNRRKFFWDKIWDEHDRWEERR